MNLKSIEIIGENQEIIKSVIPNIKAYKYKTGAEGFAYFIDEKFVLKSIEKTDKDRVLFDLYCKELKSFSELGLAYPKIYSWAIVPVVSDLGIFDYYILQERVSGRELFPHTISDIEDRCLTFCSRKKFFEAIQDKVNCNALYCKILEEFAQTFLESNLMLNGLSDDAKRKFIQTYAYINKNSMNNMPDLHTGNVIINEQNLTLIDGIIDYYKYKDWIGNNGQFKQDRFQVLTFYDLLSLFGENNILESYQRFYTIDTQNNPSNKFIELIKKNRRVLEENIMNWISLCKEELIKQPLSELDKDFLFGKVDGFLSKKNQEKVYQILEK